MLARGYVSDAGSQKFDRVTVDMSTREKAGRITFEQFHHMNLAERTELHDRYPDIYNLLSAAEKGASHEQYAGQAHTPR